DGGNAVNVVPARAVLELQVRAKTPEAVSNACKVVDRSVKAAAMAFSGKVSIHNLGGYMPYESSETLNAIHGENLKNLTGRTLGNCGHRGSSTDMGDVSMILPALHAYCGGFAGSPHGADFVVTDPEKAYIEGAKLLAMDVIDLLGEGSEASGRLAGEKRKMDKDAYLEYKESMSSTEEVCYDQA
ncbi:MAG: amidohydrolase, partial [Lentisphaeria bacterium]|nr:amidohydrolase [Lentisphaeria bacterium]